MTTPTTWLCAAVIALLLGSTWHLDNQDDHSADWPASTTLADAQAQAAAAARFEAGARALCAAELGPNAGWRLTPSGAVQCTTKRGHAPAGTPAHPALHVSAHALATPNP